MHAQNKPLIEYGDLESVHHVDKHLADSETVVEDGTPPKLSIVSGPGNLSLIEWNKGNAPVPQICAGFWNHKAKAQDAINAANAEIMREELKTVPKSKTDPAEAKTVSKSIKK
jgi:hypothetical protein